MNPSSSHTSEQDEEEKVLGILLDAFGQVCSLEEIASSYCRAERDVNMAAEILYQLQESKSNGRLHACNDVMDNEHLKKSILEDNDEKSSDLFNSSRGSKPKKLTASTGIVSDVLGKGNARNASCLVESSEVTKPLKLEIKEDLIDEVIPETLLSDFAPKNDPIHNEDVTEFLFSMLGDGFNLNMDTIEDVLGSCGFDVRKSMQYLLAISSSNLDKGKAISYDTTEYFTHRCTNLVSHHPEKNLDVASARRNFAEPHSINPERSDLPREILEAIFSAPRGPEEEPKRTRLQCGKNRTRVARQKVVSAPLDDFDAKPSINISKAQDIEDVEEDEDNYKVLRRAVKQHWDQMKEYYDAAIDTFTKGDRARTDYLLEQGKFHNKMAREADEKSTREIANTSNTEIQSDLPLDLHAHDARGAVNLLKAHLRSLAGIPNFRYLKVIVDSVVKDITKGKRKRLVLKLLEKESIEWTEEEGNQGTIIIRVDEIDPNKLSFVKDT